MLAQVSSVQAAWGDLVDGGTVTADSEWSGQNPFLFDNGGITYKGI